MMNSKRLLLTGALVFLIFTALLFVAGPRSEASLFTRMLVFAILIPPPVCFAAGLFSGVAREVTHGGAWSNALAIVVHGAGAIWILQRFFA